MCKRTTRVFSGSFIYKKMHIFLGKIKQYGGVHKWRGDPFEVSTVRHPQIGLQFTVSKTSLSFETYGLVCHCV